MKLSDNLTSISGVGYKYAALAQKLSLNTVGDLLYYFPNYYRDSSTVGTLSTLSKTGKKTVTASLVSLKNIGLRNGKFIQKGVLTDGQDDIEVVWFNQPYLVRNLTPPVNLVLSGKLNPKLTKPQLASPEFEVLKEEEAILPADSESEEKHTNSLHLGRIVPVYSLTSGLSPRWLRGRMNYLIENIDLIDDLVDSLPRELKQKFDLIDLDQALKFVHFPESTEQIILARKRLGFDELLNIQGKLLARRKAEAKHKAQNISVNKQVIGAFTKTLPFELTESQKTAVEEIYSDLEKQHPMKRLLQGDVGSGKTIVALLAALPVIDRGLQVVLLAPTTILANQHYQTISQLLANKYQIGLVTAATKQSNPQKYQLLIGTHAILANKDNYLDKVALVIIDEQHRFGVEQRRELLAMRTGELRPHLLQLTATPIPRSIALTLFGDYQVSKIIPPKTRLPVTTYLVPEQKRADSIAWIKSLLKESGQVFWILPAIEESEKIKLKSLAEFFPWIEQTFTGFKLAQVHGKVKAKNKDEEIAKFAQGKTQILVATTVVEVGIDIPGANLIVIESAERFGLAQLHQLRGRVGRANQKAWCLLYFNQENEEVRKRLEFFAKENDGIKIAEFDLQRRGPGEVYGTIQSGLPNLKIARFSNLELLRQAGEAAEILRITEGSD